MNRRTLFLFISLLLMCVGCQTQTTILNNLSERDANEIIVLLASKGIDAQKAQAVTTGVGATGEPKWDIMVPSSRITEALAILNQAGLPRVKGTSLLDLFGSQGLVPSDMQDKIRYQEGLSAQLATTIRKMDGIIDANVQITFPQEGEEEKQLTASVYVKHRGILDNPNSLAITKIKRLVASALPGLTPENVTVIADRALLADISLEPTQQMKEERDYVSIWGVVIAQDTLIRFRLIFYTFIIVLFLLACALLWTMWKIWPILRSKGFMSLYQPQQYQPTSLTEEVSSHETNEGEMEE